MNQGDVVNAISQIAPFATTATMSVGLVQVIKGMDLERRFARFYPLISLVIGYFVAHYIFNLDAVIALVTALSSGGTYETVNNTLLNNETTKIKAPENMVELPETPVPAPMGESTQPTE